MAEAELYQEGDCVLDYTAIAAISGGAVVQLADGRAGVVPTDVAAGDLGSASTEGIYTVAKAINLVWVDGQEIWWDHSANAAVLQPANDKDFYLGVAYGDATAAATTAKVQLNVQPRYLINLRDSAFQTVIVKTVVGSTTVEVPHIRQFGGTSSMVLGTTAEANKIDLLSTRAFAVESNWIVDGVVNIITNGDAAAVDFNIGVANATHASDADTITESCFIHVDGASVNILAESDDGTTEVAATDTTVDFTAGTPFHFLIDGRNTADIQIYVNGVHVLPNSVFKLDAATGPMKLLAHLEKSADDSPGTFNLDSFRVRIANE
jgi:predicted RecA/RadA family phage recombinase